MSETLSIIDALKTLVLSAPRIQGLAFSEAVLKPLQDYASLITLRRQLGENRPVFVGFIGCTGTGKSTLFNSLVGKEASLTGWKVHNTCGPVLCLPDAVLKQIIRWETASGPLLLPSFKREMYSADTHSTIFFEKQKTGTPDTLHLISQADDNRNGVDARGIGAFVFIDLPDINTSPALEERLVALQVQPWLDMVLFMVDDETIFHRIYENAVGVADELGQHRICVLSNRGKDRIEVKHPDVEQALRFFGVNEIHILPNLKEKFCFDKETPFIRLKHSITTDQKHSPSKPLTRRIAGLAQRLLEENAKREQALTALEKEISQTINTVVAKDVPVSLEKVLHNDVLQVLNHLGLKRFAISNLLNFFKMAASSRSLRRSLRLSFGSQRDRILSPYLKFDLEKLNLEVSKRFIDHKEQILFAIRRHPKIAVLQQVEPVFGKWTQRVVSMGMSPETAGPWVQELQAVLHKFEQQCAALIASDSVSSVIQNDPLVSVFLVAALVADVFAIPGFGSWFLVPTAFRYLPLGKFEATKKTFQRDVNGLIQKQLLLITTTLHEVRRQIVLTDNDPILKSLNACTQQDE